MVVKVYISGISGNKEVKKRQQRVLMILDSKNVEYEIIDITEPGKEDDKEFMQTNSKARDSKYPLPPQIFNDDDYCGDYENFDLANEVDELEQFLKTTVDDLLDEDDDVAGAADESKDKKDNSHKQQNGNSSSREVSTEKEVSKVVSEPDERQKTNSTGDDIDDDNEEEAEQDKTFEDEHDDADADAEDDEDLVAKSKNKQETTNDKTEEQEE